MKLLGSIELAPKTFVRLIYYTCLIALGLYFSRDAFHQWQEGKTNFEVSFKPISVEDLPAVTICYNDIYLSCTDLTNWTFMILGAIRREVYDVQVINSLNYSESTVRAVNWRRLCRDTRARGQCDLIYFDPEKMKQLLKKMESGENYYYDSDDWFTMEMWFESSDTLANNMTDISVFVTSKANSFGVVNKPRRFYDGNVKEIKIQKGHMKRLAINSVTDIVHVFGKCSKTSYYQTLAERFIATDFRRHNMTYVSGDSPRKSCPTNRYKCLPATLSLDIPVCSTDDGISNGQRVCSYNAIEIIKREMVENYSSSDQTLQYCNIKEYIITETETNPRITEGWGERIRLEFEFEVSRQSRVWSDGFVKSFHKEYFVMTMIGLIGTIGGTLGIFVGFSFLDSGSLVLTSAKKAYRVMIDRRI